MAIPENGIPEEEAQAASVTPPDLTGSAAAQRVRRLAKVEALRAEGTDPYPVTYPRTHTLAEIREAHGALAAGAETQDEVSIAARVMLIRDHGDLIFLDVKDESGRLQVMASKAEMGEQAFAAAREIDSGDWMGFTGRVVASAKGELSVLAKDCTLLGKALRPLPAKARPLTDPELRARQRYLDLIVTPDAKRVADIRTSAIAGIRGFLAGRGFTEVETPVLQPDAGGAAARPFITHHNALDIEMYLRIALELHLKRLIAGGYEKVFEIGRVFRNEGVDTRHNPEFTMLEAYEALADYRDMMTLTEDMVAAAAMASIGRTQITVNGQEVELAAPWRRATMYELIEEHSGVKIHPSMPVEECRRLADEHDVEYEESWGSGRICNEFYDTFCEADIVGPVFVCDHPREISPLARAHRDDPTLVERFEVVVCGRELANAYSELTDPIDQRARFEDEARAKAAGDPEAGDVDEDYLRAMEFGMPPTGGMGIGVDRLVMLLAEVTTIREVLLFPTLRPEGGDAATPQRRLLPLEPRTPRPGPAAPVANAVPTPQPERLRLPRATRSGATRRGVLAGLVGAAGLVSLLAALPALHSRLGSGAILGVDGRAGGSIASVVIGVLTLLFAGQMARGKHVAFLCVLALLVGATAIHIVKGPHPVAALMCGGLALALVWCRHDFRAPSDPPTLWASLRFIPLYLGVVVGYGVISMLTQRDKVSPDLGLGGMLETIFGGLVGLDGPYTFSNAVFNEFFYDSLLALGIVGLLVFGFLITRTLTQRDEVSTDDKARAEALVRTYGSDTLAWFALRDDKSLFFSADGRAMIAYTYLRGYALVSGDPIGADDAIAEVVDEFADWCEERGWRVAYLAVREADLPMYEARGMKSVYLGDEAIIRCDRLDIHGPGMKKLRGAVQRIGRDHELTLMRESDADGGLVDELNHISELWRGKDPERGFTMTLGQDVEGVSDDMVLAIARDDKGVVAGFLRLVPCFGADPGYSLDLMRRHPDAPNGITEFLITRTAEELGRMGVVRLSMNFAAWGRLFNADADLGPVDRTLKWVISKLNPFFQIKSLHDFNERFQPEWLPRSIVFDEAADLPRVGILYAGVEGFLNVPVIGPLLVPPVVTSHGS